MVFVLPGVNARQPQTGPHFTLPSLADEYMFDTAIQELHTSLVCEPLSWPLEELGHARDELHRRVDELLDRVLECAGRSRSARRDAVEDGEFPTVSRDLRDLTSRLQTVESLEVQVCREIQHRKGPVGSSQ